MNLSVSIDKNSLALIVDSNIQKAIGTGFVCLKPNWIFTAKHVILDQFNQARSDLSVAIFQKTQFPAKVIYFHPEVDLAVLELKEAVCNRPFATGHATLAGKKGLFCVGYSPSQSKELDEPTVYINSITNFSFEIRERSSINEECIIFEAPYSEGGHSGGPIVGEGGAVVGLVISNHKVENLLFARATGLQPILNQLELRI